MKIITKPQDLKALTDKELNQLASSLNVSGSRQQKELLIGFKLFRII